MTKEEKDAICNKLCKDMPERGLHSLMCPYTLDQWKKGQKHSDPRGEK